MKAVGQGLGYNLRRISFVAGDWLNCCSLSEGDDEIESRLRWCSCPRTPPHTTIAAAATTAATAAGRLRQSGGDPDAGELGGKARGGGRPGENRDGGDSWGLEDLVGCACGVGEAMVEVSYVCIYAKLEPGEGRLLFFFADRALCPAQKGSKGFLATVGGFARLLPLEAVDMFETYINKVAPDLELSTRS